MAHHHSMTVRSSSSSIIRLIGSNTVTWANNAYSHVQHQIDKWRSKRRIARNARMLGSLPNHILKDIGWPVINEDLNGRH